MKSNEPIGASSE